MKVMCVGTARIDVITAPPESGLAAAQGVEAQIELCPGGSAFNVAVDLVKLGADPMQIYCIGAVGDDSAASFIGKALSTQGVADRLPRIRDGRTGKYIILRGNDEERTLIVDKGASPYLSADNVIMTIDRFRPDIFYIGDIAALGNVNEQLPNILKHAKDAGAITYIDYAILGGHDPDKLFESASLIDALHCNGFEAAELTQQGSPHDAAMFFHHHGFRQTFISHGDGELICSMYGKLSGFIPFRVPCRDSTGAGDAFVSGLIAQLIATKNKESMYWLNEATLHGMVRYAMGAGAAAVTELGGTSGVSDFAVKAIINAEKR
jgi:fructokinase